MSYTKHPYVFGYTVTVDDMKDMDNGIFNNDAEITKIKNGQTTVNKAINADNATSAGDAAKLGGHPASDYATTATVTALADDVDRHAFGTESGSKNLINPTAKSGTVNGITYSRNADGTYTFSGTASAGTIVRLIDNFDNFVGTYKLVGCPSGSNCVLQYHDGAALRQENGNGVVFTSTKNATKAILQVSIASGKTVNETIKPMITADTNATYADYEPFIKSNAMLTEESIRTAELQALGWCVPSEMPIKNSFANGVLTQYVGRVCLGDLNWVYDYSYNKHHLRADGQTQNAKPAGSNWDTANAFCTKYEVKPQQYVYDNLGDKCISVTTESGIMVYDSSYTDASAFSSAVKGVYLYYELATPITHNITDLPSQKSMISDEWNSAKTYAVGDFCIYQNRLYKCLIQNSGQNPLTSTTYWQMVKVTDIGVTYEKVYITPNYGSISGVESRNFYVTDLEHSFIELHFVIMSGTLPVDANLFTLPNWASNFPTQYGIIMNNQSAYIAYNNIGGFYTTASGSINVLAGTITIRK